jgi:hypothetical protein
MNMPGFTADLSLPTKQEIYNNVGARSSATPLTGVVPQVPPIPQRCCETECFELPNGRRRCIRHCGPCF